VSAFNQTPSEAELRQLLATASRILYHQGLVDYLGHASARVPGTDRVLIKPRHSAGVHGLNTVTADRMVVIGLDGQLLEGKEEPPSERFIHTEIYRARPDVGSVVHTHQPMSTLMGIVGLPILPLLHVEAPLVERQSRARPASGRVARRPRGLPSAGAWDRERVGNRPAGHPRGNSPRAAGGSQFSGDPDRSCAACHPAGRDRRAAP
jgi:Class II Aldolase and Adducin N-terminal domain